jgi:flagellar biosynthesis protein FlhG
MSERDPSAGRGLRRAAPAAASSMAIRGLRVLGTGRWRQPLGRRAPRLIAVGAAGARMGKSVVASNLAVAIAGLGPNVILADLDLGAPGLQALFGIERSMPGLEAWLSGEVASLDATLTATGIRKLHLVTGVDRALARPLDAERRNELLDQLAQLDGDVVVVDVGAANRDDLLGLAARGAITLLVSPGERASLEATFGFLRGVAARASDRYGAGFRAALARFRGRLVGNHAGAPEDAESFHAFSRLVHEHLALPLPVLGCLRGSPRILEAAAARRPLLARRGLDENVRTFYRMGELLMLEGAAFPEGAASDLGADEPLPAAPAALPAELGRYLRKHARYPVDWAARLEFPDRVTDVRVLDVSWSGAAVDAYAGVRAGHRAVLRLHQLAGQPALPIVVMHVLPDRRRAGVAFVAPGDVSARLVAAAQASLTE